MLYVYLGSFVGFFASVVSMAEIASMYAFTPTKRKREGERNKIKKTNYTVLPHPADNTTGSASSRPPDGSASSAISLVTPPYPLYIPHTKCNRMALGLGMAGCPSQYLLSLWHAHSRSFDLQLLVNRLHV